MTGETTSPVISIVPAMEPIQLLSSTSADAGITSAIALPRRVTRSGVFVLLTCPSNDKHFALNSETAISWIDFLRAPAMPILLRTIIDYHGHYLWSIARALACRTAPFGVRRLDAAFGRGTARLALFPRALFLTSPPPRPA